MDEIGMADLCRTLATGTSRRVALGALVGLLSQGLTSSLAKEGAADGKLGGRHGKNLRGRKRRKKQEDDKSRIKEDSPEPNFELSLLVGSPSSSDYERCNTKFRDCHSLVYREDGLVRFNLNGVDLHGCNLCGFNMKGAQMKNVDFRGANLTGANLQKADLRGAEWAGADLHQTNLYEASVDYAGLNLAHFCRTTMPRLLSNQGFTSYDINDRDCDKPI